MPQADADADVVAIIEDVCGFLRAPSETPPTLAALGRRAGMSPAHLQRVFKRVVGISPRQFADACRLDRLKTDLKEGHDVTTSMMNAGYGSSSRLYERAAEQLGMTPKAYQRGGTAAAVRYAIAACDLGRLLLAATDRGICAVSLGDEPDDLLAFLRHEFPLAELSEDANGLGTWLTALLDHLAGRQPHLDLPLDVRATAFQRRVWEELRAIPYGETRTYQQIAVAIGAKTAVRAVARACATNPASLVIPCHRVIGTDGRMHGYRWGTARKQALLQRERKQINHTVTESTQKRKMEKK